MTFDEGFKLVISSLVLPIIVAYIVSVITKRREYKKNIQHSVELQIGGVEVIKNAPNRSGGIPGFFINVVQNEDFPEKPDQIHLEQEDDLGDYLQIAEKENYIFFRLGNRGESFIQIIEFVFFICGKEQPLPLNRRECFPVEVNSSIYLCARKMECPREITLLHPDYRFKFKDINMLPPFVRYPEIERFKKKKS